MATNYMATNPFPMGTFTSCLLHPSQGRLHVPRAEGQGFFLGHIYVYVCSSTGVDFSL